MKPKGNIAVVTLMAFPTSMKTNHHNHNDHYDGSSGLYIKMAKFMGFVCGSGLAAYLAKKSAEMVKNKIDELAEWKAKLDWNIDDLNEKIERLETELSSVALESKNDTEAYQNALTWETKTEEVEKLFRKQKEELIDQKKEIKDASDAELAQCAKSIQNIKQSTLLEMKGIERHYAGIIKEHTSKILKEMSELVSSYSQDTDLKLKRFNRIYRKMEALNTQLETDRPLVADK